MIPSIKFCTHGDLMYPICQTEEENFQFYCHHCGENSPAMLEDFCIFRDDYVQAKEVTAFFSEMLADPTLPTTREIECPNCALSQAVYLVEIGSSLFLQYQCITCTFVWISES